MPISVEVVTSVTPALEEAMARLLPQLSSSNPVPDRGTLHEIIASPCTLLLLARDAECIVGSLTLAMFRLPTGLRAWIEDVVVDQGVRGRGIGEALSRHALELARQEGAVTVDLTSRPSREAANRLYQRIGFEQRETNVYRYRFG
ncbi:MAG TPA: GNAT family N-acetyltransferase [Gammaproteobacteria bacterium]|nr:GNAT family N-acetyltransferase [Gammaproteobacteria bacterium]